MTVSKYDAPYQATADKDWKSVVMRGTAVPTMLASNPYRKAPRQRVPITMSRLQEWRWLFASLGGEVEEEPRRWTLKLLDILVRLS